MGRQGDSLRYDARPFGRNKRVFLFGNQVRENIFLTLVPAVVVWTGFESLLLWAYANGYAPSITIGDNPALFVVFLAIIPWWSVLYFSAHHRLLHTGFDALLLGPQKRRQARFELGDFHHQLHHRFIECNYGGLESPLDEMIGSFHDGTPQGDAALAHRRHERLSTRTARKDTGGDHRAGAG
ncbi:hypothetical protein [Candidatus Poriferisodalis sp.]|uniref:hypothetical protein n=1 Tax=Candidatus Poriferisodalis sp. TaxID=3101277 RepID=UPI003D128320